MSPEQLVFYVFAGVCLLSAVLVVTLRNLVRSIFLFFVSLFTLAGLYVFAAADFIAVAQVVIYVGGVLVLMLFAFMLSNRDLLHGIEQMQTGLRLNKALGLLVVIALFIILFIGVNAALPHASGTDTVPNTIHLIGVNTMTRYLLPFEVASVFLMMALIGAAHIARKERGQ